MKDLPFPNVHSKIRLYTYFLLNEIFSWNEKLDLF